MRLPPPVPALFALALLVAIAGPPGCSKLTSSGSASISTEQRLATLSAVETQAASLEASDSAHAASRLAEYLRGRPEFSDAGVARDGTVWGVFTDGRLYAYLNNRQPGEISAAPSGALVERARVRPLESIVPDQRQFRIFNTFGSQWVNYQDTVARYFREAGYGEVQVPFRASSLKTLTMKGVLVFHTHGGTVQPPKPRGGTYPPPIATLWTAERVSKALDEGAYKEDLAAQRVVYVTADSAFASGGFPIKATHYAVTTRFFQEYLRRENPADSSGLPDSASFVYLGACSSADQFLARAFLDQGAVACVGWTNTVKDVSDANAAKFLFDHLLGRNRYRIGGAAETPPQRPFDLAGVMRQMEAKHFDFDFDHNSYLFLYEREEGLSRRFLLAPSIEQIQFVDGYPGRARIVGSLASREPALSLQVRVNDQPVPIVRRASGGHEKPDTLECDLSNDGAGSIPAGGNLTVRVTNVSSNAVPVTEWRGQITLKQRLDPGCYAIVTWTLHVRGDVHTQRTEAGGDTTTPARTFSVAGDSKCEYGFFGTFVFPDNSGEKIYGGSGSVPVTYKLDQPAPYFRAQARYFGKQGTLDGKNNYIQLELQDLKGVSGTVTTSSREGTRVDPVSLFAAFGSILWKLDPITYAVQPDTGQGPGQLFSITWPRLNPLHPPTEATVSKPRAMALVRPRRP